VGAFVSVWQPGDHPGSQLVNEPGTWSWSELLTTDVEASKGFYGDVFGWGAETHGTGPMGAYTEWQVGGRTVAGMMQKPPMLPAEAPPFWAVYFAVADTDAAVERVVDLGGSVVVPVALLHRRPEYWERPNEFVPERWLDADAEKRRPRFAYLPFGGGPHICIGNGFSLMEATLVLATLAPRFEARLVGGMPAPEYRVLARPAGDLPMTLSPRTSAAAAAAHS